jgi:protein tyrosine phosphatase (PTP) superfamily phosphohydrolase (DUF442 family)/cytochrome c556
VDGARKSEPKIHLDAKPAYDKLPTRGIENLYRVTPRLFSGGTPDGDAAFEHLKSLGVKLVISVDGGTPNLAAAKKAGIRYIHLPMGYDTVSHEQATKLAAALRASEGAVFVHCHHGRHRGPAAMSAVLVSCEGWSREDAIAWMKQAGTAPEYAGLYAAIESFRAPSDEEIAAVGQLPETSPVSGTVESMVAIDELWDEFKEWEKGAFATPASTDEFQPAARVMLLCEQFDELRRHADSTRRGEKYMQLLRDASSTADELRRQITNPEPDPKKQADALAARVNAVTKSCIACHETFRNRSSGETPASK